MRRPSNFSKICELMISFFVAILFMNNYYEKIPAIYHFPILVIMFGAFAILLSAIFLE